MKVTFMVCAITWCLVLSTKALHGQNTYMRMAKISVDSTGLPAFNSALKEGIESALKSEPGVLTLFAVAAKKRPTRITVFEVYASEAAYQQHIQTPLFQKV